MKKGQSSLEMIVILAIMFSIFLAIIFSNNTVLSSVFQKVSHDQARSALDDIAKATTQVYQQGAGAKTTVFISLPSNVYDADVDGKTIQFTLYVSQGRNQTIYRVLDFNVSGTLPNTTGNYWINITIPQNDATNVTLSY